jgi:uncharacterized SAM-binding protein YcdF (DUF218 family)
VRPRASRFALWLLLIAALAAAGTHPVWLRAAGGYLVESEPPFPAQAVVVLAGGYSGNRVLKAAELVRAGWAQRVLVSGTFYYGRKESDLAVDWAVEKGFPRPWFLSFAHRAESTWEEARLVTAELRRLGVRRFLLVTSDYHTRRARACFRKAAPELEFRTVAAPDEDFPDPWWRSRQGRKTFLLEWAKTAAWWLGM